jgi:hypothetical protein
MADAHKNFAYSTVATAPSPATTGTTLTVAAGQGVLFPVAPFNCTVWPTGSQPISTASNATTAEIIRVTNKGTGDNWTIQRLQESLTTPRTIIVGDQIAASITAKTLTDIESNYVNSWSPFIPTSGGFGNQTISSANAIFLTNSLYLFPLTVQFPVKFNQIILPVQLSYVTSSNAASNSFSSYFGLYSLQTNNTYFSLISSNSFSLLESQSGASVTWNYPTTTATDGYGYGSFPAGNLTAIAQITSFINGTRAVGLQFGGSMSISGGQYWLGILACRSTAGFTRGLSIVGIPGAIINPINLPSTANGMRALGEAPTEWGVSNSNVSAWFGRQMVGFVSATSMPNFLGTCIPNGFALHRMGAVAAASIGSILPSVTFCST